MTQENPETDPEICQKCGVPGNDRRTLWMACLYEMRGLGVPFDQGAIHGEYVKYTGQSQNFGMPVFAEPTGESENKFNYAFYMLRVCKGCRGYWMNAIKAWYRGPVSPWNPANNDESVEGFKDDLPRLIAETERLRTELTSATIRIEAYKAELIAAEMERLQQNVKPQGT